MLCLSFADFCRAPDTQIDKCGVIYYRPKVRHPRYTCKFCSLVVHSSTTAGYPYSFFYLNPAATCIQACLTIWVSKINGDIDRTQRRFNSEYAIARRDATPVLFLTTIAQLPFITQ